MNLVSSDIFVNISVAVVTMIFTLYVTMRFRRKGRLRLVLFKKISLLTDMADRVASLTVSYNGEPVSEHLNYVEGAIVNAGNIDITRGMIVHPITLRANRNGYFVDFSKLATGMSPNWSFNSTSTQISIDADLIKRGEFLPFAALMELPETRQHHIIELGGRLAHVELQQQPSVTGDRKHQTIARGLMLGSVILVFVFWFILALFGGTSDWNPYKYVDHTSGETHDVSIEPRADGRIDLRHNYALGWAGPQTSVVRRFESATELFKPNNASIKVSIDGTPDFTSLELILVSLVPILALLTILFEWKEQRTIRRMERAILPKVQPPEGHTHEDSQTLG